MASRVRSSRRASKKAAAAGKSPHEDQFMAAAIGDVEWLRQSLKESGAPGALDRNGLAAVHLASIHGRLDCLRLLIEHYKCDVNTPSGTGWRPVHLCISAQTGPRSLQCLLYLLDRGADHSCANEDLVTPVHQAASEGHLQALQLLIKLGAKLDQADVRGFRPIDMAKIWGHQKCARLLATETWHREKDQLAKKLNLEKRVAMRDLLRQFEREEQVSADMRYQGKEPVGEWVQQVEESKGGSSRSRQRKQQQQQQQQRHQPEAAATKPSGTVAAAAAASPAERYRQPMDSDRDLQRDLQRDQLRARVREVIEEANEILGEGSGTAAASATPRQFGLQKPQLKLVTHSQDWNYSAKVSDCFHPYQRALEDAYPRDTFTRMPHPRNSFPLRLNALSSHPEATLAGDADRRAMRIVGRERGGGGGGDSDSNPDADPDSHGDADEAASVAAARRPLSGQPLDATGRSCRSPQLFASKSVLDIQRRKRFEELMRKNRGEAAAHLSSDSTSFLFRDALGLPTELEAAATALETSAADAAAVASPASGSRRSSRKSSRATAPPLLSAALKVQ